MMQENLYNDYSSWIKKTFGQRVQKISVNAGFTCPNRDGSKTTGGCSYCDNSTFNPAYANTNKSITEQLKEGIRFFSSKYPSQKYIAYFQSFSNTYAPLCELKQKYEEALNYEGVIGLSIATRPDCINDEILLYLSELSKKHFIVIEYGVETTINKTLTAINRGHTWEESTNAIILTASYKIPVCAHLIIGLPGETSADFTTHAKRISELPLTFLKLHQLQIIEGTLMAQDYAKQPKKYSPLSIDEYVSDICQFINVLSPEIIIERFTSESPPTKVIAPKWGKLKNFEVTEMIRKKLKEKNIWQGKEYHH